MCRQKPQATMKITRRDFVKSASATGAALMLTGATGCADDEGGGYVAPAYVYEGPDGPADLFQHGVASGDPLSDRVILWTRVTQSELEAVDVYWEIATDPELTNVVNAGYAPLADASRDFTVKMDADNLRPSRTYYFRFRSMNRLSPVGRTKTAPAPGASVELARVAFCSCSSLAHGYFHAYRGISEQLDLDVVVHLGDYIYEYGSGGFGNVREYEPANEIVSLDDYRTRHAQYKRDADLQAAHKQHPFIVVWDDHETANNSYQDGAGNHQPDTEGSWDARKDAAIQAYSEWMPIRDQDDISKIWRKFEYGNLFDLMMLDTRIWGRDEQSLGDRTDATRTLLGADQAQWLEDSLTNSDAAWKILGQQVMFGQLLLGEGDSVVNEDQWDGYQASRDLVFDTIEANQVDNVVVLTGDIHTSWAMDLSRDPQNANAYNAETGEGSLAVEFVVTSVTSPSFDALAGLGPLIDGIFADFDPHIKYYELVQKGFAILDIRPERLQADFYYVGDVKLPTNERLEVESSYQVRSGSAHLEEAPNQAASVLNPAQAAPDGGNELIVAAARPQLPALAQ